MSTTIHHQKILVQKGRGVCSGWHLLVHSKCVPSRDATAQQNLLRGENPQLKNA